MLYIKIIQTALALPLPAPQLSQYLDIFLFTLTFLFTGEKKAAISLPRFMKTTRRRKRFFFVQIIFFSQLRGARQGQGDFYRGTGPCRPPCKNAPADNIIFNHFNYKMETYFENVKYPQICGQCRTEDILEISYFD